MSTIPMSAGQSRGPDQTAGVKVGDVFRLRPGTYLGYDHGPDYDKGNFIHVKVLSGPDRFGSFECTTRGDDGNHLGPGGGWSKEYEQTYGTRFEAQQLEPIRPS